MTIIWTMTEAEPKARHSTSATDPEEVDKLWEDVTKLRETSSYTTRSGRRVIILSPYGEQGAVKKKRLWYRCFPVNFAKFLKTPFFIEHLWWLLLCFYTSFHLCLFCYITPFFINNPFLTSPRKLFKLF